MVRHPKGEQLNQHNTLNYFVSFVDKLRFLGLMVSYPHKLRRILFYRKESG